MTLQSMQQNNAIVHHTWNLGAVPAQLAPFQHLTCIALNDNVQGSYLEVIHQRCTAGLVDLSEGKECNLHTADTS